jgi:ATP-dependent DNA ligase
MLHMRTLPAGFIEPCLPTKADTLPSGGLWIHEIKHDGFRVIARKDGPRARLYSRAGNDLTDRFPLIVETLANLRTRSCIIDGEAVACDRDGVPSFDRLRYRRADRRSGRTWDGDPTITGIEPEWHVHSIEWDRAHLVEQAL